MSGSDADVPSDPGSGKYASPTDDKAGDIQIKPPSGDSGEKSDAGTAAASGGDALESPSKQHQGSGPESPFGVNSE